MLYLFCLTRIFTPPNHKWDREKMHDGTVYWTLFGVENERWQRRCTVTDAFLKSIPDLMVRIVLEEHGAARR